MGSTISHTLRAAAIQLERISDNAMLEARILAQHAWNMSAEELLLQSNVTTSPAQTNALQTLLTRRLSHEPISHIIGYKDFWRDRFIVTADVLTPRADSETLIEALLQHAPDKTAPLKILELGVGSGCLLLSALREYPNATGIGVDISAAALAVANKNAENLMLNARCAFFEGVWCKPLDNAQKFDIIITNPPYIAHAEIATLMPDVQGFEPHLALDGGDDGLACYRAIFKEISPHTHSESNILVEIGAGQANDISNIAASYGFRCKQIHQDLGGIARILVFQNNEGTRQIQ